MGPAMEEASPAEGGPAFSRDARSSARPSRAPRESADYNLRIISPLVRYVEQTFGAEGLRAIAAAGGLRPADFFDSSRWVTLKRSRR